jgi:hypothetical protein
MRKIYILFLTACFTSSLLAQDPVFVNTITGNNPNTSNPYSTGQTVDPGLTVSGIGRSSVLAGANAMDRYNADGFSTGAFSATTYFYFTITPTTGKYVSFFSLAFTLQRDEPQGPTSLALRCSVDNFTANIGTLAASSLTGTLNTIDLNLPQFQNIPPNTPITFRIYGWNSGNINGDLSVNDFIFRGFVTSAPLPVKLNYFNGAKQGNIFSLNWLASCSNTTGAGFTIERSSDGRNFTAINSFTASSTRCLQPFEYIDNSPLAGKNFYRLKMTEDNGKTIYSSIIILLNAETGFDIVGLLPSLVKTNAVLNVTSAQKTKLNVVVTDFAGRALQQQAFNLVAGSNQLGMNFANLAAGAYQITGVTTNGEKTTVRFIKQ